VLRDSSRSLDRGGLAVQESYGVLFLAAAQPDIDAGGVELPVVQDFGHGLDANTLAHEGGGAGVP
jgi:hypothetical protein